MLIQSLVIASVLNLKKLLVYSRPKSNSMAAAFSTQNFGCFRYFNMLCLKILGIKLLWYYENTFFGGYRKFMDTKVNYVII